MRNQGLLVLWIVTALIMAGLSFLLHGILLNDIERLEYPVESFTFFFSVTYIVIAFVLVMLVTSIDIDIASSLKGLLLGGLLGFFIYLMAFTLGLSFQSNFTQDHIFFDFAWQMIEQGIGGLIAGALYPMFRGKPVEREPGNAFSIESLIKKQPTSH